MLNHDTFDFQGFTVRVSHRTRDSYIYSIGKWSQVSRLDSGGSFDTGHSRGVFNVYGTMHVHYPCSGHIKAVISVDFPKECSENAERRTMAVAEILRGLGIPEDETYEISFRESAQTVSIQNRTNR